MIQLISLAFKASFVYHGMSMATKFKDYFDRMLDSNRELFTKFDQLHFEYSNNQDALQERFNKEGAEVMAVIREWENKLCSQSEKAGFGSYTTNLSEKFWGEVRKVYPLIDFVGVIIKNNPIHTAPQPSFSIKKIDLN